MNICYCRDACHTPLSPGRLWTPVHTIYAYQSTLPTHLLITPWSAPALVRLRQRLSLNCFWLRGRRKVHNGRRSVLRLEMQSLSHVSHVFIHDVRRNIDDLR